MKQNGKGDEGNLASMIETKGWGRMHSQKFRFTQRAGRKGQAENPSNKKGTGEEGYLRFQLTQKRNRDGC